MDYCLYQNSASNGLNQHHCSAAESGTFPFLSPKILDQRNGICPTSKKFFQQKNESKCTQTSQSVNLDGHCEFVLFLERLLLWNSRL